MKNSFFRLFINKGRPRWEMVFVLGLLNCIGCSSPPARPAPPTVPPMIGQVNSPAQSQTIQLVQHTKLPPPNTWTGNPAKDVVKQLPINLDTVFQLANDQNGDLRLAREKLNEAFGNKELADKAWLPELSVGLSYYRHEGGIQDQTGEFIHSSFGALFAGLELNGKLDLRHVVFQKIEAERKIWQQRGEVSRLSSENLLDAASTYIDLLTAKTGEALSLETEKKITKVLDQTQKLAKTEPGLKVEEYRVQAQLTAQQQITRELQAGARSAGAKLVHLLGLDPKAQLVVMDPQLVPFLLIPPNVTSEELVAQALTSGPGVRELEGLLGLINRSQAKSQGMGKLIPIFEVRMGEGLFGAGPGSRSDWDNRWDLGLHARWNISDALTAKEKQRVAQSQLHQAHLGYENLRSKLTLGIREAVETSASQAEQFTLAKKQIEDAREAHKLSESRLLNNIPGSSPSEVLLAIRSISGAQFSYLNSVRDFDKAQLRLLILTGQNRGCNLQ